MASQRSQNPKSHTLKTTKDQRTQIGGVDIYKPVTNKKLVIKSVDMEEDMRLEAVRSADEGMNKTSIEMEIAMHIKRRFDEMFPPPWHVVVGRKFGSYVTHESGYFIYFYLGHLAFLIFKSKD